MAAEALHFADTGAFGHPNVADALQLQTGPASMTPEQLDDIIAANRKQLQTQQTLKQLWTVAPWVIGGAILIAVIYSVKTSRR